MHVFEALTAGGAGELHHWDGERFARRTWAGVVSDAERVAAGLRQAGVEPGSRVATVLTNSYENVAGLLGIWLAGAAVASLPVPARAMGLDQYAAQLGRLCEHVGSPVLVAEQRLLDALSPLLGERVVLRSWDSLPSDGPSPSSPPGDDDVAFVQYSSGSTSMPKGCVLTTRAIGAQLEALASVLAPAPGDRAVSWLPLSHDMGVFGCLLCPWAYDFDLVLSSPERFVRNPGTWFGDCADFGATLTAGPSSVIEVAARALSGSQLSADLRLRTCVVGSERITLAALDRATQAFGPHGLSADVWLPAYGLAEATLMVTSIDAADEPADVHVDGAALAEGAIAEVEPDDPGAVPVVSVGRAFSGARVRVREEGRMGEIMVRSPSLFSGYLGDPELTAQRLRDGELATGDLGFTLGEELYVVGRTDDLLSVRGRTVYARDIETLVDGLAPVRNGCSTIVDVVPDDGSAPRLVMLMELREEDADCHSLAREAARMARSNAGVQLDECLFLARGSLPKTPSGKIQRFRARHLVAEEGFEPLNRVELRRAPRPATTGVAGERPPAVP